MGLCTALLVVLVSACSSGKSSSTDSGGPGTGGATGAGGKALDGGATSTGGSMVDAPMLSTGGVIGRDDAGAPSVGGASGKTDAAAPSTGGASGKVDAGAPSTGGATGKGGTTGSGGVMASGGTSAKGGASGGTSANGGRASGGSAGTGGVKGTGGTRATGGAAGVDAPAAGGAPATGGVSGSGGSAVDAPMATGGSVGTPNVTLDLATQYQTIEGFGFFGAQDNWWGNASDLWSDDWGNFVIKDLGLSMWRSEYYSEEPKQDANWAKQKPVVQGFKKVADANRVPLKFLLSVWSPPSSMKCTTASVQAGQSPCTPNPDGLKNGGSLDPSKYAAFADWLGQGIKNYADVGVDLYGISPQNEPKFVETYNSCEYDVDPTKLNSYAKMIEAVAPLVKQAYPNVKIFGTENMLALEGQQWFYSALMDSAGWPNLDVLAYHGYQDGVAPTAGSHLATYWVYVRDNWAIPHNKSSWMTETSGYTDVWTDTNGPKALGFAIYAALNYGRASAWVWWQGSELGGPPNQYALMGGMQNLGKRYFISKSFYRYIRPGAKMVKVSTTDADLFVVAFVHPTMNATTLVVINNASQDKALVLGGDGIPSTYDAYRTSASESCVSVGSVSNGSITLKADSITTLVNGNVVE